MEKEAQCLIPSCASQHKRVFVEIILIVCHPGFSLNGTFHNHNGLFVLSKEVWVAAVYVSGGSSCCYRW